MRVRSRRLRSLLAALAVVLPGRLRRYVHVRLLGHAIDPTAQIGRSFVDVDRLEMGPRARIGHLNIVRGCERVHLAADAAIAHLNFVNAVRRDRGFFSGVERRLELDLAPSARIMMMHFVDVSDRVELGEQAILTGYWSLVMTHSYEPATSRQSTRPITIGARSLVNTRTTLLPGACVPGNCLVAAGAVVTGPLDDELTLYGGVPAKPLRALSPDTAVFTSRGTVVP